jgi:hypothetical protein
MARGGTTVSDGGTFSYLPQNQQIRFANRILINSILEFYNGPMGEVLRRYFPEMPC